MGYILDVISTCSKVFRACIFLFLTGTGNFATIMAPEKNPKPASGYNQALVEVPFLPSTHFVTRIAGYDTIFLEQWEHYTKGSYRNKCVIRSNQRNQYLIVPLRKGKHSGQPVREVEISYDDNWIGTMSQQLQTEYGSLPYFRYYIDDLMSIADTRFTYLFDLNVAFLRYIFDLADIEFPDFSQGYVASPHYPVQDLRNFYNPPFFRTNADLMQKVQAGYFTFIPGHTILEALFAYGPELVCLIPQYQETLCPLF